MAACLNNYKNWYLVIVCFIYSLSYFYRNSITPIADVLEKEFNTTSTGIGMLSSFLYGSYFTMQVVVGLLLEIYSFNILLLLSSFCLGISLIVFSFTTNLINGIIIRFISGFIVAPPYVTGIAMASQLFGDQYVSMYAGLMFFCGNFTVLCSSYLQAYLIDTYHNWRTIYLYAGCASILCSISFFCVTLYEYLQNKNMLLLTLVSGSGSTTKNSAASEISMQRSDDNNMKTELISKNQNAIDSYNSTKTNTKDMDPYSFLQHLIYRKRRDIDSETDNKIISKSGEINMKQKLWNSLKLSSKNVLNYYLGLHAFCFFVIIFAMNGLWIINYLMIKYDYSRESSSIISGVFFMGTAVGSLIFGKLCQVYNKRIVLLCFNLLFCSPTIIIIYFTDKNTSFWLMNVLSCLNGIASGGSTPVHYILVREYNCYYNCEDTATGFVNTMRTSSGFIAQLLMGIMIDINWNNRGGDDYIDDDPGQRHYDTSDYNFAFLLCSISLGIAALLLIVLKETNAKNLAFD